MFHGTPPLRISWLLLKKSEMADKGRHGGEKKSWVTERQRSEPPNSNGQVFVFLMFGGGEERLCGSLGSGGGRRRPSRSLRFGRPGSWWHSRCFRRFSRLHPKLQLIPDQRATCGNDCSSAVDGAGLHKLVALKLA